MLDYLLNNTDLYNLETGQYIFHYNKDDAIAVYYIDTQTALQLAKAADDKEYWGAFLGPGGMIYDDPSYEHFDADWNISNLEYCNQYFSEGIWVTADETYLEPYITPIPTHNMQILKHALI